MRKTLVLFCTAVLVLLLGLITLASCSRLAPANQEPLPLATFTPAPPPTATPAPPAAVITGDQFQLVLTEQQLTDQAMRAVGAGASSPVRSVSVDARPGHLWVTARVMFAFAPVDTVLVVSGVAKDGRLELTLDEVQVAGANAGPRVRDQVASYLQPYLTQLAGVNQSVYVESVAVTDNEVVITGRNR